MVLRRDGRERRKLHEGAHGRNRHTPPAPLARRARERTKRCHGLPELVRPAAHPASVSLRAPARGALAIRQDFVGSLGNCAPELQTLCHPCDSTITSETEQNESAASARSPWNGREWSAESGRRLEVVWRHPFSLRSCGAAR
jgi:hypothetical protein